MSDKPEPVVAVTLGTGPMQVQLWRDPGKPEVEIVVVMHGTIWLQRTMPLSEFERLVEGRSDAEARS